MRKLHREPKGAFASENRIDNYNVENFDKKLKLYKDVQIGSQSYVLNSAFQILSHVDHINQLPAVFKN